MISHGHRILGGFRSSSQKKRKNKNISSNKFNLDEPNLVRFQDTKTISNTGPWASTRSKVAQNYLEETGPCVSTRSKIKEKYLAAVVKSNIEKNYLLATTLGVSRKLPISSRNVSISEKTTETIFDYPFKLRNLLYILFFVFTFFIGYVVYVFLDVLFLSE